MHQIRRFNSVSKISLYKCHPNNTLVTDNIVKISTHVSARSGTAIVMDSMGNIMGATSCSRKLLGRALFIYAASCVLLLSTEIQFVYARNTANLGSAWSTLGKGQQVLTALTSAPSYRYKLNVQELPGAPAGRPKCYVTVDFVNPRSPDRLQVWVANYLSNGIYSAGGICTLKLGLDGNLVLIQRGSEIWSSQTANRRVNAIELQDSGNLVLLTSARKIVWQSFDYPSDTLVSGQKFPLGSILFAADPNWPYSSAGIYSARVQETTNDLALFVDFDHPGYAGPIPNFNQTVGSDRYWTLESVYALIENAWQPNQARYVELRNGLSVFAPGDVEFIHAPSNNLNPNNTFLEYARMEPDGNLKTYVLLGSPGYEHWELNFQALFSLCQFPNGCGPYGICSGVFGPTQKCTGCPRGFHPIDPSDLTQGCRRVSKPLSSLCGESVDMIELPGVGYALLQSFYAGGDLSPIYPSIQVGSPDQCKAACLSDCACTSTFYYNITFLGQLCFKLHTNVHTLQATFSGPPAYHIAFIKT